MPRETSRARHPRRGTGGRFAAFLAPAAVIALMSAGAVAPHPQSPVAPGPQSPAPAHGPAAVGSGIATVAGGVGGPAPATRVAVFPSEHLAYRGGALYFADGGLVRQVNARTDWLTTPVGTDALGPLGDGGLATRAATDGTAGVAFDHAGNMVITAGERIRVVPARAGTFYGQAMTAGHIYTVAGGGSSLGDGGPATQATLNGPTDVAVDRAGNLVINDRDNYRIRVVAARTGTFYGKAMTVGDIYTAAGRGIPGLRR